MSDIDEIFELFIKAFEPKKKQDIHQSGDCFRNYDWYRAISLVLDTTKSISKSMVLVKWNHFMGAS